MWHDHSVSYKAQDGLISMSCTSNWTRVVINWHETNIKSWRLCHGKGMPPTVESLTCMCIASRACMVILSNTPCGMLAIICSSLLAMRKHKQDCMAVSSCEVQRSQYTHVDGIKTDWAVFRAVGSLNFAHSDISKKGRKVLGYVWDQTSAASLGSLQSVPTMLGRGLVLHNEEIIYFMQLASELEHSGRGSANHG